MKRKRQRKIYDFPMGRREALTWNRSSAFTMEEIMLQNHGLRYGYERARRAIATDPRLSSLPEEQKGEALFLIVNGVANEIAAFVETLKPMLALRSDRF